MEINSQDQVFSEAKDRLIQQTKKLYQQVFNTQSQLQELNLIVSEPLETEKLIPLLEKIAIQEKEMHKLQSQLYYLKASNIKENALHIQQAENELHVIKTERDSLVDEKQILATLYSEKIKALSANDKLIEHKKTLLADLNIAKNVNRDLRKSILDLEVKIRTANNDRIPKIIDNTKSITQEDLDHVKNINEMQSKMTQIQNNFAPKIKLLESEFTQLMTKSREKAEEEANLTKECEALQIRALALRSTEKLIEDRERILKVPIKPLESKREPFESILTRKKLALVAENDKNSKEMAKNHLISFSSPSIPSSEKSLTKSKYPSLEKEKRLNLELELEKGKKKIIFLEENSITRNKINDKELISNSQKVSDTNKIKTKMAIKMNQVTEKESPVIKTHKDQKSPMIPIIIEEKEKIVNANTHSEPKNKPTSVQIKKFEIEPKKQLTLPLKSSQILLEKTDIEKTAIKDSHNKSSKSNEIKVQDKCSPKIITKINDEKEITPLKKKNYKQNEANDQTLKISSKVEREESNKVLHEPQKDSEKNITLVEKQNNSILNEKKSELIIDLVDFDPEVVPKRILRKQVKGHSECIGTGD